MTLLPRFTFLCGPKGSGKTTLAKSLAKLDPHLSLMSFAEPLRAALISTYYPDESFDVEPEHDLQDELVKASPLPFPSRTPDLSTHRNWLIEYSRFLKTFHGDDSILGRLALSTIERNQRFYHRYLFDDARTPGDVHPFSDVVSKAHILFVHLSREGFTSDEVGVPLENEPGRHIHLKVNKPPEALAKELLLVLDTEKL